MKKMTILGLLACALILIYSLSMIGYGYYENYHGNQIHLNAQKTYLTQASALGDIEAIKSNLPFVEPGIKVDFEPLQQINSDIFGWIFIPETIVSYPLLAGVDNQKYLNTTFDNKKSKFGSIFIDMANGTDLADQHTIIYGHNINNGAMFGQLHNYMDQAYFEANRYIYVVFPTGYLKYEIFSARYTTVQEGVYQTQFNDSDAFSQFLAELKASNYLQNTLTPTAIDKVITLSTCTSPNKKEQRFVVHAVLIANHLQ